MIVVTTDEKARRRRMGQAIKKAREDRRLSQSELANLVVEELGAEETLDQSMISRYEHGRAVPEPPKRRALERILGLPAGDLYRLLEPETDQRDTVPGDLSERIGRLEDQMSEVLAILRRR